MGLDICIPALFISGEIFFLYVLSAVTFLAPITEFFDWLRPAVAESFKWFLATAANIFVLFCLVLLSSPFGSIGLGRKDAVTDVSYTGWFAKLFASARASA